MKSFSNHSTPDLQLIKYSLNMTREKIESIIKGDSSKFGVEAKSIISNQYYPEFDNDISFLMVLNSDIKRLEELLNAINDELKSR
ncbi:MAG: hypothetical protein ABSE72_04430 [Bacteroidales bacterium]|jgi:signal recognition particle subunit SEC65